MRLCSPHASRSLTRSEGIVNVYFLGRAAIDSSTVSPLTHTEGLPSSVLSVVQERDVDDENGNELARTRRRHSLGIWYGHPGLAEQHAKPVHRRRGCACVAPRPRWVFIRRGWFDTTRPQCERVPLICCARWLSPEPTDHVRYRTCADGTMRPPQPSAGVGTWTPLTGAP